jgi:hypothetical protein
MTEGKVLTISEVGPGDATVGYGLGEGLSEEVIGCRLETTVFSEGAYNTM